MSNLIPIANEDAVGLGVGRRTIGRYIKNPPPGFPIPVRINGRLYFVDEDLNAYKAALIGCAVGLRAQVRASNAEAV